MKHRELSKLAKQLRSSFYGSDEWDTFTEEWEHVATHVRKKFCDMCGNPREEKA